MRKYFFFILSLLSLQSCIYKCDVFPDFSDAHVVLNGEKLYSDTLFREGGVVSVEIDLIVTNTTKLTTYKSGLLRYRAVCGEEVLYFVQDSIVCSRWGKPDQKCPYVLDFWIGENNSGSNRDIELQYSLYRDDNKDAYWTKWNKVMDVLQLDYTPTSLE